MNVLFVLTQDLASPAGAGRYLPLARALTRIGHRVRVVGLHPDYDALGRKQFSVEGVEVTYVGQMHVRKVGQDKVYFPAHRLAAVAAIATWQLVRATMRAEVDVIHVGKPHPMNGVAGILARRLRHVPLVVDCDDLEAVNNRFGSAVQRWGVSLIERLTVREADHITTHSSVIRAHLMDWGTSRERITYLPHGMEPARFRVATEDAVSRLRTELALEGRSVVAYIGSLSCVSHALLDLIEAFRVVVQDHREAVLLLAGGGEDHVMLRERVAALGMAPHVRFCGRISSDEVPLYYQLADVSVDPVRDNAAGRASLSLKMFESWSAGVPLVTVDVGDRWSVVGDPPAALVVPPDDADAMARAIGKLLRDPHLRRVLRERARARTDLYSWDHHARTVTSIYDHLVTQASRRA